MHYLSRFEIFEKKSLQLDTNSSYLNKNFATYKLALKNI